MPPVHENECVSGAARVIGVRCHELEQVARRSSTDGETIVQKTARAMPDICGSAGMSVPKKRILSASVDIEINRISGRAVMLDCLAVSTD